MLRARTYLHAIPNLYEKLDQAITTANDILKTHRTIAPKTLYRLQRLKDAIPPLMTIRAPSASAIYLTHNDEAYLHINYRSSI